MQDLRIHFSPAACILPGGRLGNLASGNTISRYPVFTRYRETRPNTNLIRQVEKNV
jgi:hypothetical protein